MLYRFSAGQQLSKLIFCLVVVVIVAGDKVVQWFSNIVHQIRTQKYLILHVISSWPRLTYSNIVGLFIHHKQDKWLFVQFEH